MVNTKVATAQYGTVITAIGAAKIAACILNGTKINITHAAVGDGAGTYYKPTLEQLSLLRECWRGEIASANLSESNQNMIDVKFIVPAEIGGFTVREAALIDADGDTIAICNTPDAEKVAITDGVSFPLTMVMHIIVSDASVVSFSVNPALDTVSREEMEEALKRHSAGVGSAIKADISMPVSGWTDHESDEAGFCDYPYKIDIEVHGCTETHFPNVALSVASLEPASDAGVCATAETFDGFVRILAKQIPTVVLEATVLLRSENLTYPDASGESGSTSCAHEVATDDEVSDAIEEVYGEEGTSPPPTGVEIATDEEVAQTVSDIFG